MKKIFSIVFFALMLFKMGGFFLFFIAEKEYAREKYEEKIISNIPQNQLKCIADSTLKLSKTSWERGDKELKINGELYDIVRVEIRDNEQYFYCLLDSEETIIEQQINTLFSLQNEGFPTKNNLISCLNILFQNFILTEKIIFLPKNIFYLKVSNFIKLPLNYSSISLSVISPPPQDLA